MGTGRRIGQGGGDVNMSSCGREMPWEDENIKVRGGKAREKGIRVVGK